MHHQTTVVAGLAQLAILAESEVRWLPVSAVLVAALPRKPQIRANRCNFCLPKGAATTHLENTVLLALLACSGNTATETSGLPVAGATECPLRPWGPGASGDRRGGGSCVW